MIFKKQVRLLQPQLFFLTVFHPERPRCHVIMFLEYPMKITVIFIAYSRNDVTDRQICFTHQLYSLVQTFSLKKFLEIKPCAFLDHLTEDMHGKMQTTTKLRQRSSPVFLFNIIQCCHRDHIFVLIGQTHLHIENIVLLISDDGVGISPEMEKASPAAPISQFIIHTGDSKFSMEIITDSLIPASLEKGQRLRSASLHIAKSNLCSTKIFIQK